VEEYRGLIQDWVKAGVEVAAIRQRLMERGYTGSYASVWRFVNTIKADGPPETTTRVETKPGEEAQVDFGYAGRMIDPASGELRKAWAFVMLLSWSRHRKAFEVLGGLPERVRIDNLKAAILKAVFDDPQVRCRTLPGGHA
jgi:transposase